MPTHDYIIANGTGAAVRADINSALSAIVSLNSSASEPGTMYAYQLWADTAAGLLKIRNGANSAWITLRQLDGDFSIVAVEDGLQATPSLTFTNDLNTGVFRSGADALAIVTGGQYAIACTSTQAVGIKTANPNAALHVAGNTRVGADSAADAILEIGEGATGNRNSYIDIVGDTTYTDYGLRVIRNNTGANATSELKHRGTGALNFTTQEAAPIVFNTTNSPALTILAGGNVGIGTSSPQSVLNISAASGGDTSGLRITRTDAGGGDWRIWSSATANGEGAGKLIFGNTANRVTIDGSGNVGIGSTTPSAKLVCDGHVQITNAAPPTTGAGLELSYGQINASRTSQQSYNRTGSAYLGSDYDALDYRWYISGSQKATIDSSGNLLVGGTSNTAGSRILAENASGDQIAIRYTGIATYYLNTTSGGDLAINKDASERLRIDSSGRLLVGTSTARTDYFNNSLTAMLQVEGTNFGGNADRACISIVNNNNVTVLEAPVLILGRSNGSTVNSRTLVSDGTLCGYISFQGADGSDLVEAASIAAEINGTVGANRMPGRLVFSTATDASPSVMTERMRITSAGVLQIAEAGNITVGTTTGTKIGTATTQKLGFYNATPVVQPTAVADATTAVDVITQLNALLAKLRTLGIIAT